MLHFIRHGANEGRPAVPAPGVGAYLGQVGLQSIDKYVQLPLTFPTEPVRSSLRVAVMFHCYYTDLLDRYRRYFNNIPIEFDLKISTDTVEKRDAIAAAFADGPQRSIEIAVGPNRGRDVAPRFVHFRADYAQYDLVLHVHTKNLSTTRFWRTGQTSF